MKTLKQHIAESKALHQNVNIKENFKFKINRNNDVYAYHPTTWDELRQIIEDRYKDLGTGTAEAPIDFNDIDVSNIVSFSNENKKGIFEEIEFEYIDVSDWDVSKIKNMSYAFYKCDYLESVGDLSKWNVSNVEYMHSMFNDCTHLKSVGDLSDWDVSKVKNMIHMFYDSGITNIPDWYKE